MSARDEEKVGEGRGEARRGPTILQRHTQNSFSRQRVWGGGRVSGVLCYTGCRGPIALATLTQGQVKSLHVRNMGQSVVYVCLNHHRGGHKTPPREGYGGNCGAGNAVFIGNLSFVDDTGRGNGHR